MRFLEEVWDFIKGLSPIKLSLLILSPFTLSLLIHVSILTLTAYTTWYIPMLHIKDEPVATILFEDGKSDRFSFQTSSNLNQFKVNNHMSYPIPQVEYRPVLPDVKSFPEPTIREELDLIGVETIDRKWLDPATDRQFLYTGAEKLAGSFSRHIQVLRGGGLDVVFVFDSTSSMAEFLKRVKIKIANLVDTFKKLVPTARIGLVTYRDVGDDFVTKMHQLTYGTKSLQIFLREIEPVGGGDREEAVDEALRVAIDKLNWRKRSKKIILLIGDAPPHQKDMEKTTALIEKFRKRMGGMVAALDTSRQTIRPMASADNVVVKQKEVLEEFKHFAKIGGGESARLVDEEKVIRQMVVLVFGTRWEGCLDEFLKNL
jgi:hypothetical protein